MFSNNIAFFVKRYHDLMGWAMTHMVRPHLISPEAMLISRRPEGVVWNHGAGWLTPPQL